MERRKRDWEERGRKRKEWREATWPELYVLFVIRPSPHSEWFRSPLKKLVDSLSVIQLNMKQSKQRKKSQRKAICSFGAMSWVGEESWGRLKKWWIEDPFIFVNIWKLHPQKKPQCKQICLAAYKRENSWIAGHLHTSVSEWVILTF